jgi:hypothetical protein
LMSTYFLKAGKFSALIILNWCSMPLVCISTPSSLPIIYKFNLILIMSQSIESCDHTFFFITNTIK